MYSHNKVTYSGTQANTGFRPNLCKTGQSTNPLPALQSKKILDQVRERIRYLHYSMRTEESYLYWIRNFIRWAGVRHPVEMGADEVRGFLTYLAVERKVAVSTHRVALSVLLFLYQKVLLVELPWLDGLRRPTAPRRLPCALRDAETANIPFLTALAGALRRCVAFVWPATRHSTRLALHPTSTTKNGTLTISASLTTNEVSKIFTLMSGQHALLVRLLHGTGMRITEALQLRILRTSIFITAQSLSAKRRASRIVS